MTRCLVPLVLAVAARFLVSDNELDHLFCFNGESHRSGNLHRAQSLFYTALMPEEKTQRSNCRFLLQQMPDGKPLIIVQLYQDTIPVLQKVVIGFDLLGGTQKEQAKKLTELLNEHVLDVFLTVTEKGKEV
jgi:hypothetical protein